MVESTMPTAPKMTIKTSLYDETMDNSTTLSSLTGWSLLVLGIQAHLLDHLSYFNLGISVILRAQIK